MSVTPKRNLPPASEQWGRSVDQRLDTIQAQSSRQSQDIGNTLTGVNASLVRLSEQVGEIRTITETLVEQQTTLQAQQEQLQTQQQTLTQQQAQLTQTVGELQTVVNGMIRPTSQQSTSGGFEITGTRTPNDSITLPVPVGYTRAVVIAMSGVTAQNTTSNSGFLYNEITMNDVNAGESYTGIGSLGYSLVSIQATRFMSVTPGGELTIVSKVRNSPSATWAGPNGGRLVAQVLFLR